jgi:nucleoside-diphosphate-sugar epimerase
MKKHNISVLGCGWLGLPLLKSLVAEGHHVNGSSRNPDTLTAIKAAGGHAFYNDLPDQITRGFFGGLLSTLIITLPPRGRSLGEEATAHYLKCLKAIPLLHTGSIPRIIFTSSTGIYGDTSGIITETTLTQPNTHSGRAVEAAENWLDSTASTYAVLRLAGLVSSDRHPGRFYGGSDRLISQADAPVNLVHRDGVIEAIHLLLKKGWQRGDTYNVCASAHPPKGGFYTAAAKSLGLEVKGTDAGGANGKIVSSQKLRGLGWKPTWDGLDLKGLTLP